MCDINSIKCGRRSKSVIFLYVIKSKLVSPKNRLLCFMLLVTTKKKHRCTKNEEKEIKHNSK